MSLDGLACSGAASAGEEAYWWRVELLAVISKGWHLFTTARKDAAHQLRGQIEVQGGKRGI